MGNEMGWTDACCCWSVIIVVILLAAEVYLRIREPKKLAAREQRRYQRNELINKLQELHPIVKSVCAEMALELFPSNSLGFGLLPSWKRQLKKVITTARTMAKELGAYDTEDWLRIQDVAWEQNGHQSRSWTLEAICPLKEPIMVEVPDIPYGVWGEPTIKMPITGEKVPLLPPRKKVKCFYVIGQYTIDLAKDENNQWCFVLHGGEKTTQTMGASEEALRQGFSQLRGQPRFSWFPPVIGDDPLAYLHDCEEIIPKRSHLQNEQDTDSQ